MRTVMRSFVVTAALALGLAGAQVPLSIATGGTGGVYYPVGGGYAQIIDQYVDGYTATVEATNASVDNVAFISRGDADIALALADTVLAAYEGTGNFGPGGDLPRLPNLRAITVAYTNAVHVIVRADSPIQSLQDLRGRRVSVGAPGSGTEVSANTILEAVGITYDDFTVQRLGANETADALRDGAIDAGFWSGGMPTGAVMSLAETHDIRLLPISDEELELIRAADPTLIRYTFPADGYRGVGETPSIGTPNLIIVAAEMDEELAYQFTKALFEHIDVVRNIHPSANETTPESALDSPIPLHPGAIRYLEEIGLTVPDSLRAD
ncbi:MAG TPA: TAXI family TRAP transporter solute-binding subunit [Trueperaceae bacterium]|nr:TAXI family TRAP transporter solute-binding subunit [Trueperaceae bacterium]